MSDPGLWFLALHIIAFSAWMAGMWYLPRLMVYHADADIGSDKSDMLKTMERRLLRAIMTPAMIATFVFGLALATYYDYWSQPWLHGKLLFVVLLAGAHGLMAKHVKLFADDARPKPPSWYRIFNEVPTVLFLLIVFFVIIKPF